MCRTRGGAVLRISLAGGTDQRLAFAEIEIRGTASINGHRQGDSLSQQPIEPSPRLLELVANLPEVHQPIHEPAAVHSAGALNARFDALEKSMAAVQSTDTPLPASVSDRLRTLEVAVDQLLHEQQQA